MHRGCTSGWSLTPGALTDMRPEVRGCIRHPAIRIRQSVRWEAWSFRQVLSDDRRVKLFVQVFEGWRYREGARQRLVDMGLGVAPQAAPRPGVPGLIARLLATDPNDPDTGIGLWVWESQAACRDYEAARTPEAKAALAAEIDESRLTERHFDALFFGASIETESGPE